MTTVGEAFGLNCDATAPGGPIGCKWPFCSCPKRGEEAGWFWWGDGRDVGEGPRFDGQNDPTP